MKLAGEQFPHEIIEIIAEYCQTADISSYITAVCAENDSKMVTRYITHFLKKRRADDLKRMWDEEVKKAKDLYKENYKKNPKHKTPDEFVNSLLNNDKVSEAECRDGNFSPF